MIIRRYNKEGVVFEYYIGNHKENQIGLCDTTVKNDIVYIECIETNYKYRSKGIGTFLIKYVINYFKYHKKKIIYGSFCPERKKDCKKLYNFYHKNGFTFIFKEKDIQIKYLLNKYTI